MRFVECVDYGDVRTKIICGIASICLIAPDMIEVRYFEQGEGSDGQIEYRLSDRQVWSRSTFLGEIEKLRKTMIDLDQVPRLVASQ
jgi:hypothetical protein